MEKRKWKAIVFLVFSFCVCACVCPSILADTETQNVTTITQTPRATSLTDKLALNYVGVFRGGPLIDWKNSCQPKIDGTIDRNNPLSFENQVTAGYRLNQEWMLGSIAHFLYFPAGNPVGTGQNISFLDPALTLSKTNIINSNGMKLNGSLLAQFPLSQSDYLKPNHVATALSSVVTLSYSPPMSKFSFGIYGYLRNYIHTQNSPKDCRVYKIYFAPNANYQLTDKVSFTLWVDLIQAHTITGAGLISGLQNEVVDIEPGINFNINKDISFNPILNIYPSHPTSRSTSFQANISAKAF